MLPAGRDPTRRNRKIGTAASGYGKDNRLVIPWPWATDRMFHERVVDAVVIPMPVAPANLHLIVEPPFPGFRHASTPRDVERVLRLIPPADLLDIKLIVMRQPKRKELLLSSVWGRLQYWSEVLQFTGPAIHLEAQPRGAVNRWKSPLSLDQLSELDRLRLDGHQIEITRRERVITTTPEAIRRTQLFRTLPHEVGHYVDYLESVTRVDDPLRKECRLDELYWTKPSKDKEDFAHRYATEFFERHEREGALPFDPLPLTGPQIKAGLKHEWFA